MKSQPIQPRELETMAAYDTAIDRIIAMMRGGLVGPMTTHEIAEHCLGCAPARQAEDDFIPEEWLAILAATAIQRLAAL